MASETLPTGNAPAPKRQAGTPVAPPKTGPLVREVGAAPSTTASYTSHSGERLEFNLYNAQGKIRADLQNLILVLALREIGLGGSPLTVLDAFKVQVLDAHGHQVLPVAAELLTKPPRRGRNSD